MLRKVTALAAIFVLIALAVVCYHALKRGAELERQVTLLTRRVETAGERIAELDERSQQARARAEEAAEGAKAAALGRLQAEAAQMEAEAKSRQAEEEARLARAEAERVRQEREAQLARLQESLNRIVETRRTALGLVMNLGEDFIQFEFDRAVLRAHERELLSRIAGILLTWDGYRVQVFGHTDDIGSEEYNVELSKRRAQAVRDYLIETGIDPEIITTQGYGKTRPLVQATSSKARAKNRRVEIGIVDAVVQYKRALPETG